jgi:RNA polymerase sigma factor (sigma-70 family)
MAKDLQGSVSQWIEGVREGDSLAAQRLWNRYFSQLVRVAIGRLGNITRKVSGEDVALSALKSVMIGIREDRFPALKDRDGLWPLLFTITARKSIIEIRRQSAQKRSLETDIKWSNVQEMIGKEPSVEFAAEFYDTLDSLILKLKDPALWLIVQRKLEGYTNEDVAKELACSVRTVMRKLRRIRQEWVASESL